MNFIVTLITTYGFIKVGLVLAGIFLIFLLIMLIAAKSGRNINFELGPFKFNSKKDDSINDKLNKINALVSFNNESNFQREETLIDTIINATRSKTREKDIIEFRQTVINQLSCAEDFNIQIKTLLCETYAKMMREKDSTLDVKTHRDYKFYQVLVSSILDELKRNTLKESIKTIDFQVMDDIDFQAYIDQKTNVLITLLIEYLDLMYQTSTLVTRDEVHDANEKLAKQLKEIYHSLYHNIRTIAIEDKKMIEHIEDKLNKELDDLKNKIHNDCTMIKVTNIMKEGTDATI